MDFLNSLRQRAHLIATLSMLREKVQGAPPYEPARRRGCTLRGFLFQVNLVAGIDAADGFLLGKRVATSEEMPTVGASPSDFSILCGDFGAVYELVRIGGMGIIRDDVTTPGKTKLYVAQRFAAVS